MAKKSPLEAALENTHKCIGRAGFLISMQITVRKFRKSDTVEAREKLLKAADILKQLLEGKPDL